MNFTAIDFETATGSRASICAIGLARVEQGQIVDTYSALIQPPNNRFYRPFTDEIHGISWRDTLNAPTFAELYPELAPRLTGQVLVAHNVSFDRDVLIKTMAYYGLDYDALNIPEWRCTLELYRAKGFKPADLATCCNRLGIPLNHHDALSDAMACAKLLLKA